MRNIISLSSFKFIPVNPVYIEKNRLVDVYIKKVGQDNIIVEDHLTDPDFIAILKSQGISDENIESLKRGAF